MKVGGLAILLGLSAICLPVGDLALAQGQEETPEADESTRGTEEEKEEGTRETGLSETVKVTATRVETDLMKTPVAVSAFDQETLDREGVQTVRDLAQLVPNMDIATKNGQSTPIISLRGVRSTNETELGDPAVGVHLDGVYSPRMQGILALMFDNERVEVLRGPQGTLFGRNSTVGSINIISAKPQFDALRSRVFLQYGNFNAPEVQGMFNMPLTDTFAVRLAGRYFQRDSYVQGYWDPNQYDQRRISGLVDGAPTIAPGSFGDCTSPECLTQTQNFNFFVDDTGDAIHALVPAESGDFYMNAKEWAYRVSGRWQPRHNRMSLNLSYQRYRNESAGGIDLVNCEKLRGRPTYELDPNTNEVVRDANGNPIVTGVDDCSTRFPEDDTYQAVVNTPGMLYLDIRYLRSQFDWDIKDNLRFVALAGSEDQDRESAQDMEQSLNAWDQAMFFLPGTGSNSWVGELQLQSFGNRRFNGIAGVNYFYEKTSTIGYFDNPLDEKALWVQPNRSTTASAFFAQGTYSFSDKWHLTIGGRYSDETKEDRGGRSYICNASPQNGCSNGDIGTINIDGAPRFDRNDLNGLPANYFEDPSLYPVFNANDNKGSWNHTDWRIGLDYQRNENTLFYTYLATGFKAGGIGDVFEGTIVDFDVDPGADPDLLYDDQPIISSFSFEDVVIRTAYDPEEVTTLELGFKQRFLNGKLNLRGAYFFSDYTNMQYASVGSFAFTSDFQALRDANGQFIEEDTDGDGQPNPGAIARAKVVRPLIVAYFTQNVPGAEIQGFELEYDSRPWRGGRIFGFASWLDTEITQDWNTKWDYDPMSYFDLSFDESQDPENDRLEVNLRGNELAVSAPFKLRMTVDHAFLMPKRQMTITPWVTGYWEADSYLTIWNVDKHTDLNFAILPQDIRYTDDKREAWSMFHAGLRVHWGPYMAELFGYNLTDEVVQYWGGAAERVPKGSMSVPRTYGIRFQYEF